MSYLYKQTFTPPYNPQILKTMQTRTMIFVGLVVVAAGFIILTALAKRPSVLEVTARLNAQKDLRDQYAQNEFVPLGFSGEITEIEDFVVRVPLREMRYRVFFEPEGKIVKPSSAPDSTNFYDFSDPENPWIMLTTEQGDLADEEYFLIKKPGQSVFYIQEDDDEEMDTLQISFRLFEAPEDLGPWLDSAEKKYGDQIEF